MTVSCICGHVSDAGARYCANCGRPLAAARPAEKAHGPNAARRPRGLLDRVWDFFASVPVAVVLLFLLAAAAVLGTLIDQEGQYSSWMPPDQYYPARYGPLWGRIILATGLSHAYTSWWFLTLMGMLGLSLTVCTLQRGIPLYRALHRPTVAPPPGFFHHAPQRFTFPAGPDPLAPLAGALRRRRYRVTILGDRLFAEQGRWGRWGPYILHAGLIVVLLGGMSRAIPGWYREDFLWVRDGETVPVPGTGWSVHSRGFTAEFYPDGRPKLYATDAVVIENGQPVKEHRILMNEPLAHRGVELYQSSYRTELDKAVIQIRARGTEKVLGEFSVDLTNPAPQYRAGDLEVAVLDYYPDFALDAANRPTTRSPDPLNPAFVFRVTAAGGTVHGPTWFFPFYPDVHFDQSLPFEFVVRELTEVNVTGLRVKQDRGVPIIYLGLAIATAGVFLTFYLSHRRIWAMVDGSEVHVAGQAHRGRALFAREFARLAASLGATPAAPAPAGR
ncbi:cytochrome c biogenesis protein ResB [Caldinitratiruptor microaerophilus]|uniref:Cytochrome c biogenesis protein ResB n=1 Tax=Caldinitratiruptor microaerophilus TaxID=671077 RepID=A0AA35CPI8_9FIRM|nr:cytochrome c biogenesis protein ResB [Caldinitratiruptor microaerophilus]BDG61632.1 cytochrome c biogenesis protein ResB [Caldinitratiruptor microaerophilus]